MTDQWAVVVAASLAVPAGACGALPLAFRRRVSPAALGSGTAMAAGVMLAVAGGLVLESPNRTGLMVAGGAAGMLFVQVLRWGLARHGDLDVTALAAPDGHRAFLIVAVLTAHSAADAVGLASAFAGSPTLGWAIGLALAVHKLPVGFAISVVLVPRGVSVRGAACFAAIAALPVPLLALPAFFVFDAFSALLPVALGFAAGALIYVVLSEMLPEAQRSRPRRSVVFCCSAAFTAVALVEIAAAAA